MVIPDTAVEGKDVLGNTGVRGGGWLIIVLLVAATSVSNGIVWYSQGRY